MTQNISEFVWKRLSEWGLSRVFGYPGDGVGGLDIALEKAKNFMHYVQVRHEEMAAFMASAHAKFTGEVGSLLCHLRPRRDSPSHGSLRCEGRSYARSRDRRTTGTHGTRCQLSARSGSAKPFQGCRRRFCHDRKRPESGEATHRSCGTHCAQLGARSRASSCRMICSCCLTKIPPMAHGLHPYGCRLRGPCARPPTPRLCNEPPMS